MAANGLFCSAKVSVGHSSERTTSTTVCLPWTEPLSRSTTLRKRHRRRSRCAQLPCSPVMSWPCSRDRGCPLHGNDPVRCRLRQHLCKAQRADVTSRRQHYLSHCVEIPTIRATTAAAGQLLRMVTLGGGCSGWTRTARWPSGTFLRQPSLGGSATSRRCTPWTCLRARLCHRLASQLPWMPYASHREGLQLGSL